MSECDGEGPICKQAKGYCTAHVIQWLADSAKKDNRIRALEAEVQDQMKLIEDNQTLKARAEKLEAELSECRLWHSAERTKELKDRAEKAEAELAKWKAANPFELAAAREIVKERTDWKAQSDKYQGMWTKAEAERDALRSQLLAAIGDALRAAFRAATRVAEADEVILKLTQGGVHWCDGAYRGFKDGECGGDHLKSGGRDSGAGAVNPESGTADPANGNADEARTTVAANPPDSHRKRGKP